MSPPTEELPSYHHDFERDSTLSTALHSLFSWAQTVLRSARLPDPSTVGFVLLCALWYMSSALSSNTGKSILTQFRYPVTLTFVQFAFVAAYSVAFLAARERIGSRHRSAAWGWGIKRPTRTMFHGTFVMSLFQIAGHVFSSMAIARVPVSTVHTIKVRALPATSLIPRPSRHCSPSFRTRSFSAFGTAPPPTSPSSP